MRLDFFMFADGASAADGKVYIHGGAITKVHPPTYPSPPFMLTAVVRLLVDPDETGPGTVTLEWRKASEQAWSRLIGGDVSVPEPSPEERKGEEDQGVLIVANMLLSFETAGSHEFRLRMDDDELAVRRLFLTPLDDPSRPQAKEPQGSRPTDSPEDAPGS